MAAEDVSGHKGIAPRIERCGSRFLVSPGSCLQHVLNAVKDLPVYNTEIRLDRRKRFPTFQDARVCRVAQDRLDR